MYLKAKTIVTRTDPTQTSICSTKTRTAVSIRIAGMFFHCYVLSVRDFLLFGHFLLSLQVTSALWRFPLRVESTQGPLFGFALRAQSLIISRYLRATHSFLFPGTSKTWTATEDKTLHLLSSGVVGRACFPSPVSPLDARRFFELCHPGSTTGYPKRRSS